MYDKPRQCIKKQRHYFAEKIHLVKGMVFPAVIYVCENWNIKRAECWRTDVFKLWCWRRLLRVRWAAGRSNHSILKEINPEYSWEGLMLKLKLQYFGPSDVNSWLIGKFPDAEKDWGQKEKRASEDGITGWHHWCNGHALGQTLEDGEKQRDLVCCTMGCMGSERVRHNRATEKQQ